MNEVLNQLWFPEDNIPVKPIPHDYLLGNSASEMWGLVIKFIQVFTRQMKLYLFYT